MNSACQIFRDAVIGFCDWAESNHHDLMTARHHLLSLMSSIPSVDAFRHASDSEKDYPRREIDGWKADHNRFTDLVFQHYRVVFDPHEIDTDEEPVMGDLCDNFADIYGDLWHGLQALNDGDEAEALSLWIDSYFFHWGQHASSALNAIDTYYRQNYYSIKETEQAAASDR